MNKNDVIRPVCLLDGFLEGPLEGQGPFGEGQGEVRGGPLRVPGSIPERQGVLLHCLIELLWVPEVHWEG